MKDLLGGKGANLADMTNMGLPVPPGFTITTQTCKDYNDLGQKLPKGLMQEVEQHLCRVEKATGKKFGDPKNPLLVAGRSGAKVSMPGMMDTVLNIGMNDKVVEGMAHLTNNPRFAYDSYRRLINMYGDTVMGVDHEHFEHELSQVKQARGVSEDTQLNVDDLKEVVQRYKKVYRDHVGEDFPQDPMDQLEGAIKAVFGSWMGDRAIKYRQINDVHGLLGTAVNVQSMVFGNMGDDCATGVAFTRNPSTGENKFFGEFLVNAQGEDVVAGIRTPIDCQEMGTQWSKKSWGELLKIKDTLETRYQRRAGFRVHHRKRQALHAPDPHRQAQCRGRGEDRRRYGQGKIDRRKNRRPAQSIRPVSISFCTPCLIPTPSGWSSPRDLPASPARP